MTEGVSGNVTKHARGGSSAARALVIAPRFFGYEAEIVAEVSRRGYEVDFLPDRPFDSALMKAATRVATDVISRAATELFRRALTSFGASDYAYILVINGQTLSRGFLQELRAQFPTARLVLYMWDSLDNRSSVRKNLDLFDSTFTFDPDCARAFGMNFRPLFFGREFEPSGDGLLDLHLSFIGTAHSDRYSVVRALQLQLPADFNCFWYLYLQAPWVYWLYRATNSSMRRAKRSEFQFVPLTKVVVRDVFRRSRVILDIEHPKQRGLTMRTFEALGSRKKLVTTNSNIVDYEFFSKENFCVIDRKRPFVDEEFLRSEYRALSDDVYLRYSIGGWVDEVMGST